MKVDIKKADDLAGVLVKCYGESTKKSQELTVNAFGGKDNLRMIAIVRWAKMRCNHLDYQVGNFFAAAVDLGVRIGLAQKNGDEVEEEETFDWEDEEKVNKLLRRAFLFKKLTPYYPLESVRLMCIGKLHIPFWVVKELKAEKVGKSERTSGC